VANITIRNIPESVFQKIKTLSKLERRSMNNELLILIEKGLTQESKLEQDIYINKEQQISIWESIKGKWEDDRTTEDIIDSIYSQRTEGRDVSL
jgi:plasmid stability protein